MAGRALPDDGGYLLLWRSFEEHRYWQEERVFSFAEAFMDCFAFMAAHTPYVRRVRGVDVELDRGQFLASFRYLQKRWGWGVAKLQRFFRETQSEGELEPVRETHAGTVYRVVNYERYQPVRNANQNGDRTQSERSQNEYKQDKARGNKGRGRAHALPDSWEPTAEHKKMALELGLSLPTEVAKLRDWARAKGERKLDWNATFRNWLRKSGEGRRPHRPAPTPVHSQRDLDAYMRKRGLA